VFLFLSDYGHVNVNILPLRSSVSGFVHRYQSMYCLVLCPCLIRDW